MLYPRTRRSTGVLLSALLGAALALCVGTPVRAANPRITLKLENVTAAEAVEALGKASGIPMHLEERPEERQPKDMARASFHWEDVPLAQVMRELRAQSRLVFSPGAPDGGYQVWQGSRAGQARPLPAATEQNGLLFTVTQVSAESERSLLLLHDVVSRSSRLRLDLHLQFPGGDAEAIRGITDVCAKDDLGDVLVGSGSDGGFGSNGLLPDEWSGLVFLSGYQPRARKLLWLEGEVEQYGPIQERVLTIPLPQPAGKTKYEADGFQVKVKELVLPEAGNQNSPTAILEVNSPAIRKLFQSHAIASPVRVALQGVSGKLYCGGVKGIAGRGEPQLDLAEVTCEWKPVAEAVTALRITTLERGDLRALTTFRLTDLPLPDQTVSGARPRVVGRLREAPKAPERAFFDPEGGSLGGKVIVSSANDPQVLNGDISFGLTPILPDKEVATRWMDVRLLLPDGSANLEHVAPGTYRVLRAFHPGEAIALPRPGHWANSELIVRILAGKETVLPPLEWTVNAPAGRPTR